MLFLVFVAVGVLAGIDYPAWLGWALLAADAATVALLWGASIFLAKRF